MGKTIYEKNSNMNIKFHKNTFENISNERREKIFEMAIKEFAANGYAGANINKIAKNAQVSIGSLYSYFASKEDLFLSIIDIGCSVIAEVFDNIDTDENFYVILDRLLIETREYAIKYPELNQIYIDITTQSVSKFSSIISSKLEEKTAMKYREIIRKAKDRNEIRKDIEDDVIAFYIDNLVITYQFSFASNYYKKRMRIFLMDKNIDDNQVRRELLKLIENSLLSFLWK